MAGKMNALIRHGKQHLSSAAQIAEPREDLPDNLLDPKARIEQHANIQVPQLADRRRVA